MLTGLPNDFTYQIGRRPLIRGARPSDALREEIAPFKIARRGRLWEVLDPDGTLVCLTAYKRGAVEVVRRLNNK